MTTRTINDTESIARQQLLLQAMDARATHYAAVSAAEGAHGHGAYAVEFALLSNCCRRVADRTRERLVAVSELALTDVEADEPPSTLVGLVDWIRERWGQYFPFVPSVTWQSVGYLLHAHRRRP